METAARSLGIKLHIVDVRDAGGLDHALSTVAKARPGPLFNLHRKRIAEFGLTRRIPTVGFDRHQIADGVLLSSGPSIAESYRRSAMYVDRILKGTRPADLPVEQPTTFELAINLRTASALGITIPPSLRVRADEIIE